MQEARDGLDRIIAKLLEDLNNMGLDFNHPTNPFGLQPGEGSSKDLEGDVSDGAGRGRGLQYGKGCICDSLWTPITYKVSIRTWVSIIKVSIRSWVTCF